MAEVADKDIKKTQNRQILRYRSRMAYRIEGDCCLVVDELGLDLKVVSVMAREACFSESGVYPVRGPYERSKDPCSIFMF